MGRPNNPRWKRGRTKGHSTYLGGSIDTQVLLRCAGCGEPHQPIFVPHQVAPITHAVEPCQKCLAGAIVEGRSEGYSEGLADSSGHKGLYRIPLPLHLLYYWGCLRCGFMARNDMDGDPCPDCGAALFAARSSRSVSTKRFRPRR